MESRTVAPAKGQMKSLVVLALVLGLGGFGLGAYSVFFDGRSVGSSSPMLGITQPGNNTVISGEVSVRIVLWSASPCTLKVLINGSLNATALPWQWDTNAPQFSDGWWNLTVLATDASGHVAQDQVLVNVLNHPEQGPVYYCSSQAEITAALASIGAGAGTVVVTQNITLSSSIAINGGGSYIIEGIAPEITVDCGGNRRAFDVSLAASCTIRDLSVDARDLISTIYTIDVAAASASLENLRIIGDDGNVGIGIMLRGTYASITNCYIYRFSIGIYANGANATHVSGNTIPGCGTGILIFRNLVSCENNIITQCSYGITVSASNCTIANNNLVDVRSRGIASGGMKNTFTGNTVLGNTNAGFLYGIYLNDDADLNVLTGNIVNTFHSSGGGTGYGIYIASGAFETVVAGNAFLYNDVNVQNLSATTILFGNNDAP